VSLIDTDHNEDAHMSRRDGIVFAAYYDFHPELVEN
jgi:hypothetical protein